MNTHDQVELRQGDYWRARKELTDEEIPAGQVLLLKSIRFADGEPHTIILDGHPSRQIKYNIEHRFLVEDFLLAFEYVAPEEAAHIRQRELAELQDHIEKIQKETSVAHSNPQILRPALTAGIRDWEKAHNVKVGSTDDLPVIDPSAVALVPTLVEQDVEKIRLGIDRKGEEARLTAQWFEGKAAELATLTEGMIPFIKERAAAALARVSDVVAYVDKLKKGIESLDLYLGKGVEILPIAKGESAPDDIPLSIQQSKLFVDEELAVYAEVDEKYDVRNLQQFRDRLAASRGLQDQIFPSLRSVVCMATSRQHKDYSGMNPLAAAQLDLANKEVFLLVRDGENIYEVTSPIETHLYATHRLFPSKDEMDEIFQDRNWRYGFDTGKSVQEVTEINYMNVEYTDRLSKHEAVSLHYKRFLVLLAGLDHKHNLFGRFHNLPQSMDFMTARFQSQFMRFIYDDEYNRLQLPGKVESFKEYAAKQNALLRSGSRVMCFWPHVVNPGTAYALTRENTRTCNFEFRVRFREKSSICVAFREGDSIYVKAPVKRDSYNSDQEFNAKVNLSRFKPGYYSNGIGFLVLDQVKAADLYAFIHNRSLRKQFLDYLRVFKAAVSYLRSEEERQARARAALLEAVTAGELANGSEAESIVDEAIMTWRAANRGAEIPATDDPDYRKLLEQVYHLSTQGGLQLRVSDWANSKEITPLRLTVTGKGKVTLYTAPRPAERNDWLFPHVWTKRLRMKLAKRTVSIESESWAVLPEASATEKTIFEWPEAKEWAGLTEPVPFKEKEQLLLDLGVDLPSWLDASWTPEQFSAQFTLWKSFRDRENLKYSRTTVCNPIYSHVIGVLYASKADKSKNRVQVLTLDAYAEDVLVSKALTEADVDRVATEYARWYKGPYRSQRISSLKNSRLKFGLAVRSAGYETVNNMTEASSAFNSDQFLPEDQIKILEALERVGKDWRGGRTPGYVPTGVKVSVELSKAFVERFFDGKVPDLSAINK